MSGSWVAVGGIGQGARGRSPVLLSRIKGANVSRVRAPSSFSRQTEEVRLIQWPPPTPHSGKATRRRTKRGPAGSGAVRTISAPLRLCTMPAGGGAFQSNRSDVEKLRWQLAKLWRKWLGRRNRGSKPSGWQQFDDVLRVFPLIPAKIVHSAM